ncbi:MLO-like protein 4 isoform X1 [Solanum pennellii]|uniref:MLO-like protein n=2 Tax=Solanum pennellii TaxID=28526 RepID=A0ABM1G037_SOLPN|nr:MLO-like protein 4 isoform X1 [Solanum pennellii]
MGNLEGASFAETPTWAVATVVAVLVSIGFLIHGSLKKFGKWLHRTKREPLYAALEKIKEELMVFGLLSLLMGHWIVYIAKICVKSSAVSSHFYPCSPPRNKMKSAITRFALSGSSYSNFSTSRLLLSSGHEDFCPEGLQSFASKESLEQLHRFLLVLGVSHVSYSFFAIALAMIKIYSWRTWENYAKSIALQRLKGSEEAVPNNTRMGRLSTFTFHQTTHPWSQHRVLVWLLCFSRQFWSSINEADYMALRLAFITTHQLPLTYDFHKYMLRSMEEEFRDIVGISVPLWIFVILCVFLSFHGTNIYFWISFFPAILILLVGTKLHRVVVKLAVEIIDSSPLEGFHQFNLRDELFWFGKPRFLLRIIQFVSFQNAFEMATYIWSLWEIKGSSCFTDNHTFLVIRLSFGVVSQFWCSFVTFPLYVIVAQMGSRYKKTIVSENVRTSLHGWRHKVKTRLEGSVVSPEILLATTSLESLAEDEVDQIHSIATISTEVFAESTVESKQRVPLEQSCTNEISECDELHIPLSPRNHGEV